MSPRVRSLKKITPKVWIPPTYDALYKLEVVRSDGTLDDITDLIHEGEITDGVTETIGNFRFTIDNSDETRTGIWVGNEVFNYYCDYATSATTKRFRGRIDKVAHRDNTIVITGRAESAKLLDLTVTQAYVGVETSVILKELFDTYATEFTYTNVNTSTTNFTVNWYQKPFWECVQELCNAAGFDAYVDSSLDCHFFSEGSVLNPTEAVIHESNILEVDDFAQDKSLIKNRVVVYGAEFDGIPLIKTAENDASMTADGVRELIINDTNITTEAQCQERADYELDLSLSPPRTGDVKSLGLATLQPGEKIYISAPQSNLPPTSYKIATYTHKFEGFMNTTLNIEREPRKIFHIVKDRIVQEQKLAENPNPNEMRYSIIYDFSSDIGTHADTQITDGVLKTDGSSSGTWISPTTTVSKNITVIEPRIEGDVLAGTRIFVSLDGGAFVQIAGPNTAISTVASGKEIKIKLELPSASTQVTTMGFLYKT